MVYLKKGFTEYLNLYNANLPDQSSFHGDFCSGVRLLKTQRVIERECASIFSPHYVSNFMGNKTFTLRPRNFSAEFRPEFSRFSKFSHRFRRPRFRANRGDRCNFLAPYLAASGSSLRAPRTRPKPTFDPGYNRTRGRLFGKAYLESKSMTSSFGPPRLMETLIQ